MSLKKKKKKKREANVQVKGEETGYRNDLDLTVRPLLPT